MNQPTTPRGVSMPTVVLGLLLGLVATGVLVRELTGRTLDVELSAPIVLLAAGALLVVWAVTGLARQRVRQSAPEPATLPDAPDDDAAPSA